MHLSNLYAIKSKLLMYPRSNYHLWNVKSFEPIPLGVRHHRIHFLPPHCIQVPALSWFSSIKHSCLGLISFYILRPSGMKKWFFLGGGIGGGNIFQKYYFGHNFYSRSNFVRIPDPARLDVFGPSMYSKLVFCFQTWTFH